MLAKYFLSSCVDFSEKMIFGNGDVFHTVSPLLFVFRVLSVRNRAVRAKISPDKKSKPMIYNTGFAFLVFAFFANQ